mmetsp:Transcript_26820/g.67462  ORF Transcript_26820/g.67462 Transcript_26820/m.67462 type:complete len:213 (+) Transcript_26820:1841-2479(+)
MGSRGRGQLPVARMARCPKSPASLGRRIGLQMCWSRRLPPALLTCRHLNKAAGRASQKLPSRCLRCWKPSSTRRAAARIRSIGLDRTATRTQGIPRAGARPPPHMKPSRIRSRSRRPSTCGRRSPRTDLKRREAAARSPSTLTRRSYPAAGSWRGCVRRSISQAAPPAGRRLPVKTGARLRMWQRQSMRTRTRWQFSNTTKTQSARCTISST